MKTTVAFVLFVVLAALGCGGGMRARRPASGTGPAEFTVINHSNDEIRYLFLTASDATELGADKLGPGNAIAIGAEFTVPNIAPGDWNVRVEDSAQNYKEWSGQTFEPGGVYELEVTGDGWSAP